MRIQTLRLGSTGPLVEHWQNFLLGLGHYKDKICDGQFGPKTAAAVKAFQTVNKLTPVDGIIGNTTWGKAMSLGLEVMPAAATTGKAAPNWPARPEGFNPLNLKQKKELFGSFTSKPAPVQGNAEGIQILKRSEKFKIARVQVPQLAGVRGAPRSGNVFFHAAGADRLASLFQAWEDKDLIDRVLTWGGSYVPRYVRGSRTTLSNHSWGTAFDINVAWNGLNRRPALVGEKGSVRELVKLAAKHGFFWGGWYGASGGRSGGRSDGMHFELIRLK